MRFSEVKKDSLLKLDGITFDVTRNEAGGVQTLKMTDKSGHVMLVTRAESYLETIRIQQPAGPKLVKKQELSGTVAGLQVRHVFDDFNAAARAKHDYEDATREGHCTLKIEEVDVPEDE